MLPPGVVERGHRSGKMPTRGRDPVRLHHRASLLNAGMCLSLVCRKSFTIALLPTVALFPSVLQQVIEGAGFSRD